jgi:hypothetical protein
MKKSDVKDDLVTVQKKGNPPGFTIPKAPAYNYDMLDLAHLTSKITGHPLCSMFEEIDFAFAVIFPKGKDGIGSLKVSRGLGDVRRLKCYLKKWIVTQNKGSVQ